MTTNPKHISCEAARPYMYYFLSGDVDNQTPNEITRHILNCPSCQTECYLLKENLIFQTNLTDKKNLASENLKLHFAYAGKRVTCERIKPYLPSLLIPGLQVLIPTPVTAHVDRCHACTHDLGTIKSLELDPSQLSRLSQLLAKITNFDANPYQQILPIITAVAKLNFRNVPATLLKLLCLHPDYRDALYQERQKIIVNLESKTLNPNTACHNIPLKILFDYAIPFGRKPAAEKFNPAEETRQEHILNCPKCLKRIQSIHQSIFAIPKNNSGVVTTFDIDKHTKISPNDSENQNPRWSFTVKVRHQNDQDSASSFDDNTAKPVLKNLRLHPKSRLNWFLGSAAAAAVIFIGLFFSFLSQPQPVEGLIPHSLAKNMADVDNVYVVQYAPPQTTPLFQMWCSRTIQQRLYVNSECAVLWDLPAHIIKKKIFESNTIETEPISDENLDKMKYAIDQSVENFPTKFYYANSSNQEWRQINDPKISAIVPGSDVYELNWQNAASKVICDRKFRCYVHPALHVVIRVEHYEKIDTDENYTLSSFRSLEYPSDQKIREEIKKFFN